MKKVAILLATLAGLQAGGAHAADGTVKVTGLIGAATCVITGTTGSDVLVVLPTVAGMSLSNAGQVAGITPFSIALSHCNGTTAQTHFELSNTIDQASGNLYNAGSATGVEVQLLNADLQPINLLTNDNSQTIDLVGTSPNKTGLLNYYAQYIAVAGGASAGSVKASVQYSMIYN